MILESEKIAMNKKRIEMLAMMVLGGSRWLMVVVSLSLLTWSGATSKALGNNWRSSLYPENWMPPGPENSFYENAFLQDFSYAGYKRGEESIPNVTGPIFDVTDPAYGADPTGASDSTAAIRAAIDAAASAGGGVVYLPAGSYAVEPSGSNNEALRISTANILLRGAGVGETFIVNTSYEMRSKAVIRVQPTSSPSGGTVVAITEDLEGPTRRIPVADAAAFTVGDIVRMEWEFTQAWIEEHDQQTWWGDTGSGFPANARYLREVLAVNETEGWIDVDIPTRYTMKTRDNANVRTVTGMLTGVGLEDFSIGNVQHPGTEFGEADYTVEGRAAWDTHASWLISVRDTYDSWISGVESYQPAGNTTTAHMLSNGISFINSFRNTIQNAAMRRAQYGGGGGNGYMYRIQHSNDNLIKDSIADFSRHGFVISHAGTSGNVFRHCEDRETARATGDTTDGEGYVTNGSGSDHHMHFSHSNLFEGCEAHNSYWEAQHRIHFGTVGHGLTSAHGVYWNTIGSGSRGGAVVRSQQGRYGYVIGTSGSRTSVNNPGGNGTEPIDIVQGVGVGDTLEPQVLSVDQFDKRMEGVLVSAGEDIMVLPNAAHTLSGSVYTYGSGPVSQEWSQVSGPATTFADTNALETTVDLSEEGEYVLELTAWDGDITNSATATITVDSNPPVTYLFEDDFEGYKVDDEIGTAVWGSASGRPHYMMVRDENAATPFGSSNQFGELKDIGTGLGDFLELQSPEYSEATAAVTTFAFDFFEPSDGGDDNIIIGYAMGDGELNSAGGRLRITLNNGSIGGGVDGGTTAYNEDMAYRMFIVFNDTALPVSYQGGEIAAESADVWFQPLSGGPPVYAGAVDTENTQASTYTVGFRTFNEPTQELWIDNVTLEEGTISIDAAIASELDGIVWSNLDTIEITENSAEAMATVNTNLTEAVLVWDTDDQGDEDTAYWANSESLGSVVQGTVTGRMTGLDASTEYVWRMYGETSETNGWSAAVTFQTDEAVVVVPRGRFDTIIGESQDEGVNPLGYFTNAQEDGLSGIRGAGGQRTDHNPVIKFALPTLDDGEIIESVTINYEIYEQRHHQNQDFDAHVYLLDTADPSGTGTAFFYHGDSDPNPNVMFIGETELERDGNDTVLLDPPVTASHTLAGDALVWILELYDGTEPIQENVFFRFNRSIPSRSNLDGSAYDRFFVDTDPEVLFLEITTAEAPPPVQASGGSFTNVFFDAEIDEWVAVHIFTEDGTFMPSRPLEVEYLVVAGGGGGGGNADNRWGGGGGGAGGMVEGVTNLAVDSYAVVVGAGGAGAVGTAIPTAEVNQGENSSLGTIVALGGARARGQNNSYDGGSGSGGGPATSQGFVPSPGGIGLQPASASGGFGSDGGAGTDDIGTNRAGGGGGGAGEKGEDAGSSQGGAGGAGRASSITGEEVFYAGGGGGSSAGSGGAGGIGGGGAGVVDGDGEDGQPNTGGGGGASGGQGNPNTGGDGGSGIVILRYTLTEPAGTIIRFF